MVPVLSKEFLDIQANYRVWIHSETRISHDNNIQSSTHSCNESSFDFTPYILVNYCEILQCIFYLLFLFFHYFLFAFFLLSHFASFLVILYYPLLFWSIPLSSFYQILGHLFLLTIYLFLLYFDDCFLLASFFYFLHC